MIITVKELIKELQRIDENKFIIVHCKDNKQDYAIEGIKDHVENGHVNYEIRVGKNVE